MILLQKDDWTLEEIDRSDNRHLRWPSVTHQYVSLIKHVCYPDGKHPYKDVASCRLVHQVVCYPDDSVHCWRCLKVIPEGIVACWKFQNWETLSYGET
jgi:hypothetical protein